MEKPLLFFCLVFTASFSLSLSQDAPARPDINELLAIMRQGQITRPYVHWNSGAIPVLIGPMLREANVPADISAKVQLKGLHMVEDDLQWDKIKPEIARIYAETFTPAETRDIIAFYKSPAGQAFLNKQPEIEKKIQEVADKRAIALMPKITELVNEVIKAPKPTP